MSNQNLFPKTNTSDNFPLKCPRTQFNRSYHKHKLEGAPYCYLQPRVTTNNNNHTQLLPGNVSSARTRTYLVVVIAAVSRRITQRSEKLVYISITSSRQIQPATAAAAAVEVLEKLCVCSRPWLFAPGLSSAEIFARILWASFPLASFTFRPFYAWVRRLMSRPTPWQQQQLHVACSAAHFWHAPSSLAN